VRSFIRLLLLAGLMAVHLPAATVQFQVTTVGVTGTGNTLFRYNYFLSGLDFLVNQALDIQFGPTLFGSLSNGGAGTGFSLLLLQPNNPPQASGEYSALATLDHPSLAQTFSVDFTYTGSGSPGAQFYSVDQFNANGGFVGVLSSGNTIPAVSNPVPEPSVFLLAGFGLLIGCVWALRCRSLDRSRLRAN